MIDTLVLSGGSIRGAFQAGAIGYALESGIVPKLVYGISVGALNGAFLADRSGRAATQSKPVDWPQIGDDLVTFWQKNITKPGDLIEKQFGATIAFDALFNKFDGLISTKPLQDLIRREIIAANIQQSPVNFSAGTVNLNSGDIVYANRGFLNIIDYVIASSAIPVLMPFSNIGGSLYYDGGMRDVAPLSKAIEDGATDILVITCQANKLDTPNLQPGNILQLVERIMDIVKDEILKNDLSQLDRINRLLKASGSMAPSILSEYRLIPRKLIEPQDVLAVDIETFTNVDIENMLALGRFTAKQVLG